MHRERHLERRAAWVVLAPAVTLLLAGCGDNKADRADATASHASASATATAATSAPPSPSPSALLALPKAADGTHLRACSDARCEVEVKAGDAIRFSGGAISKVGFEDMAVKSVHTKEVVFELASGRATFTQPGPHGSANINRISLTLVGTDGRHAVIRLGGFKRGELTVVVGPDGGMQVTTPGN